ncbi:MAG: hypothetical protein LBG29_04665 [Synergistaceae bacterium]|jgi:hypothetical protein|nr:hypothetical protein [Synergistaceae bacterium]
MSQYKKIALTLAIIMISVLSAYKPPFPANVASAQEEPRTELKCPDGWTCGELKITQLDAVSGKQGFWSEREYRTGNGVSLKAALIGGKGPAWLNVPAPGLESGDGFLGAGKTYETLFAGDYPAILELDRLLGTSLSVIIPGATLTIETPESLSGDDIVELALVLLHAM